MRILVSMFIALAAGASQAIAGTCPTSSDVYSVYSATPQPGASGSPSYVVRRTILPLQIDDIMLVVPLGVPDMVVGATTGAGNLFAQYVSSLPVAQVPAASSGPSLGFKTAVVKTSSTGCPALLFEKAGASFMIRFNADGSIASTQRLDGSSGGVDVGAYDITVTDVNGDGLQDVVLKKSGAVRSVLLAQANGTLVANATASVNALWSSFVAACAAGDRQAAVSHLWSGSANASAAGLLDPASDLTKLSNGIVDMEAVAVTPTVYTITVVYQHTTPAEYVSYKLNVANFSGEWYLQSM